MSVEIAPKPIAAPVTPESTDLTTRAILVKATINAYGTRKKSRTMAEEAAVKHNGKQAAFYTAVETVTAGAKEEITKVTTHIRSITYKYTLPWDENSWRLCPVQHYPAFRREILQAENDYMDAVDKMLSNYDSMKDEYERSVGAVLAAENRFPAKEEMRDRYGVSLYEMPIANPSDIRLNNMDPKMVDQMRVRITELMEERIEDTAFHVVQNMAKLVERVVEQCGKEDPRIFQTLIGNIEEAVELSHALNVGNNPDLNNLIEKVRISLAGIDTEDLKRDKKFRKQTGQVASTVLDDLKNFGT